MLGKGPSGHDLGHPNHNAWEIDMATKGQSLDPPTRTARPITSFCRVNLEIQGNLGMTDAELRTHRAGLRFAYQMCFSITLVGTVLQSIPVLAVAATTAFLAMFPPNHPFDNVYNATVGRMLHRPKLPPRIGAGSIRLQSRDPLAHCGHRAVRGRDADGGYRRGCGPAPDGRPGWLLRRLHPLDGVQPGGVQAPHPQAALTACTGGLRRSGLALLAQSTFQLAARVYVIGVDP